MNNKLLYVILFLYILFFIYLIYYHQNIENFDSFIEGIKKLHNPKYVYGNNVNKNELKEPIETTIISSEPIYKSIYIDIDNKISSNARYKKYIFKNSNKNKYMTMIFNKEIHFYDNKNNKIGFLQNEMYGKYIFKLDLIHSDNVHIEFYNNYLEAKIYLDNDDNIFYLKNQNQNQNQNQYTLYLFQKEIGYINKNENKITVYEEYKEYLNYFGIAYIIDIIYNA